MSGIGDNRIVNTNVRKRSESASNKDRENHHCVGKLVSLTILNKVSRYQFN